MFSQNRENIYMTVGVKNLNNGELKFTVKNLNQMQVGEEQNVTK